MILSLGGHDVVIIVASLLCCISVISTEKIPIKVVEEPVNYEFGNLEFGDGGDSEDILALHITPANFSGPEHFIYLLGKCFNWTGLRYKFVFCPFHNVTQHELATTWNPYRGILGVWGEWEIHNNQFENMMMVEGDPCGDVSRSTKVIFECGNSSKVLNITEPKKCHYSLEFMTPLVCHNHSMLVYPRLSPDHQTQWNQLETELFYADITKKGYKAGLHRIFQEAGLVMSREQRDSLRVGLKKSVSEPHRRPEFRNIFQCEQEYARLERDLVQLQEQVIAQDKELRILRQHINQGNEVDSKNYTIGDAELQNR